MLYSWYRNHFSYFFREELTMPRPKGSKNKVKNLKGHSAADYAAALAEKNAEKDQLNGEISAIMAQITELKEQLKSKKAAVKSTDKAIEKLQEKLSAEQAKEAQQAHKAEIDSAVQKLITNGVSVEEILEKLQ